MEAGQMTGPFIHDLTEHILSTKDSASSDGIYNLIDCDRSELMRHIPIPKWCKNLEDAGLCHSIIRRMISLMAVYNPTEALKIAHELMMVYERKVKP